MTALDSLISENASAVFGLIGALVGGSFGFGTSWFLRRKEVSYKLWERLIDKRIAAHEHVIGIALQMRVMVGLPGNLQGKDLMRCPNVLYTRETFLEWFRDAISSITQHTTWLGTATKREFNFLQDYLINLNEYLKRHPDLDVHRLGNQIRHDFVEISSSLEKVAFEYFERDMQKLKLHTLTDWHKYPKETTLARLQATRLFSLMAPKNSDSEDMS